MRARRAALAAVAALPASLLPALAAHGAETEVVITAPLTVGPLDTHITPAGGDPVPLETAAIVVHGATLTMNGRHAVASLILESGAVLTHDAGFAFDYSDGAGMDVVEGLALEVSGSMSVDATSKINLNARGWPADEGPGAGQSGPGCGGIVTQKGSGAGHGGRGGNGCVLGGGAYGSFSAPTHLGSGGGSTTIRVGGRGGGALRLIVEGALMLDGVITANGGNGQSAADASAGGGSGGSVWIEATAIVGAGAVSANGGAGGSGSFSNGGGGGGGRAVLTADLIALPAPAQACGNGGPRGGAGTVLMIEAGHATLRIDNCGAAGQTTDLLEPIAANDVVVQGQAKMAPAAEMALDIVAEGSIEVKADGAVTATSRGFAADEGPGAGGGGPGCGGIVTAKGSGGGHGGRGGNGCLSGGLPHGSYAAPTEFGSGGGSTSERIGGRGGGAIRMRASTSIQIDGVVEANGGTGGSAAGGSAGGGAGGSIWLQAPAIGGAGAIRANGGSGGSSTFSNGGGGGGGRIRLDASSLTFKGELAACGGGSPRGGAGTLFVVHGGHETLILDNCGTAGQTTEMIEPAVADTIIVRGQARMSTPPLVRLEAFASESFVVEPTGVVTINARGYPANQGPGAGNGNNCVGCGGISTQKGSGGAYGGSGGAGCAAGGAGYGHFDAPDDFGSGGGSTCGATGGAGGGALRIVAGDAIVIDGVIQANGTAGAGVAGASSGGGAGGGVWLEAPVVAGAGTVSAQGGAGGNVQFSVAGDGGGGRIAVFTCDLQMSVDAFQAPGGSGGVGGGPGTVHFGVADRCARELFVAMDPRSTHLRTCMDLAPAPSIVPLSAISAAPGDWIRITTVGDYGFTAEGDPTAGRGAWLVFSSNDDFLIDHAVLHRVPGAVEAALDVVTAGTHFDSCDWPSDTDIPEDFEVVGTVVIQAPPGAHYLFLSAIDEYFSDNVDEEGDYGAWLSLFTTDLDGSGSVDGGDLGVLLGSWGACAGCPSDLNGDGVVDGADMGLFLGSWE